MKVTAPKDYLGDIMGDLSSRRGRIQGTEAVDDDQVVTAQVPMSEMRRYAMDLRQMTQGRGTFERQYSHYEEVPRDVLDKLIAEGRVAQEEVA